MRERLFWWSLILHPIFITMDTTTLVNSASFLGEEGRDLGFQKADSVQERATSKTKHQQSLSSFSRPNSLDLRFFSSPWILCARLLLSRTSHRMARSWFARELRVAQRFEKKEEMVTAYARGETSAITTRLHWLLFMRLLAHRIDSILRFFSD